jgi:diketogulonate reductase-like aldo/keto reductase
MAPLPSVTLFSGEDVAALGQGTHNMARQPDRRVGEVAALRTGLDLGMTVVDTAENYGDGESEKLVAEALGARRNGVFIVSKVAPVHARSADGVVSACDASLRRLRTDHLDLYLLHWPRDDEPLAVETFDALQSLVTDGKTRYWGVSNFALSDMRDLAEMGFQPAANQILYNLRRRGAEHDLIGWCRMHRVAIMAYCPIEQGAMVADPRLTKVGSRHGATAAQVAIAWLLQQGVIPIPKAGSVEHVRENAAAADLELSADDLVDLDDAFPRPSGPVPFDML